MFNNKWKWDTLNNKSGMRSRTNLEHIQKQIWDMFNNNSRTVQKQMYNSSTINLDHVQKQVWNMFNNKSRTVNNKS